MAPNFRITRTASGIRLSQHGVVLSEVRSQPGPTHSVFDVLAALACGLQPEEPITLLGFAGGSIMAPLRALSPATPVSTVDLDPSGYTLFQQHASTWAGHLSWQQADAVDWLRTRTEALPVIIDDLSIVSDRKVVKPDVCYDVLPQMMLRKLRPSGVAICNLLRPARMTWPEGLARFTHVFPAMCLVHLKDFENRIVVAGQTLPSARDLGCRIRALLGQLHSRQAIRLRVETII